MISRSTWFGWFLAFVLGVWAGAWMFRDVQPRTFLSVHDEKVRFSAPELLGLVGSAFVQHAPKLVPGVIVVTDKTIAMKYPIPWKSKHHFVVVPRRDIRDVGTLAKGDEPYLVDAFAVISKVARDDGMKRYKVITNGPDAQFVRYLHFHVVSIDPKGTPSDDRDTTEWK
ncbi:MAG: HIT domain-containing protein [Candidatus Eisenbacteria bacterium]